VFSAPESEEARSVDVAKPAEARARRSSSAEFGREPNVQFADFGFLCALSAE
jgi:hypothetical protein